MCGIIGDVNASANDDRNIVNSIVAAIDAVSMMSGILLLVLLDTMVAGCFLQCCSTLSGAADLVLVGGGGDFIQPQGYTCPIGGWGAVGLHNSDTNMAIWQ